jgi:uncharacterized membrane protein
MSLDAITFIAILAMAIVTYGSRLSGLALAGRLKLDGRAKAAFDAIPPAVLTAVIAPALFATGWAETIAGVATILAATRLPLIGTILVGVAAIVLARAVI